MYKICSREDIEYALNRIEDQMECGYLDIGELVGDDIEMHIIRVALQDYRKNHNLEKNNEST